LEYKEHYEKCKKVEESNENAKANLLDKRKMKYRISCHLPQDLGKLSTEQHLNVLVVN